MLAAKVRRGKVLSRVAPAFHQHRPVVCARLSVPQDREARQEAAEAPPKGAFGQAYPQSRPSRAWLDGPSAAVSHGRVVPVGKHKAADRVDSDGLPMPGAVVWPGQTYYSTKDTVTGRFKAHKLKGEEVGHVEQVRTQRRRVTTASRSHV